jgi:hypothetical protein
VLVLDRDPLHLIELDVVDRAVVELRHETGHGRHTKARSAIGDPARQIVRVVSTRGQRYGNRRTHRPPQRQNEIGYHTEECEGEPEDLSFHGSSVLPLKPPGVRHRFVIDPPQLHIRPWLIARAV